MTSGYSNHFDGTPTTGVLARHRRPGAAGDPNDATGMTRLFERHNDIAAVILEPTGANFGRMPIRPEFLSCCAS